MDSVGVPNVLAIAKAIKAFIKLCLPGKPNAIFLIVSDGVSTSKT
jgi:hypothetical protein